MLLYPPSSGKVYIPIHTGRRLPYVYCISTLYASVNIIHITSLCGSLCTIYIMAHSHFASIAKSEKLSESLGI